MYELLGICLSLVALLTINAFASLIVASGGRLLQRPLRRLSAATRAEVLFAMRVTPPALALIVVALFLIPSYIGYEPHSSGEVVSSKLAALALISIAGVLFALWRSLHSWLATRALLREWTAVAKRIELPGTNIPAFRLPHAFPIIAVVGALRPRLFIAEQVLHTLKAEELAAAIAHEGGHLAARDNLKRSLLRICRDALMIVPCGRALDRAWAEAAESAADEHAADQNAHTALDLASALIAIARMVPEGGRPTMPAAAFLLGDETTGVEARVGRLLDLAMSKGRRQSRLANWVPLLAKAGLIAAPLSLAIISAGSRSLAVLHEAMEHVVRILS